MTTPFTIRYDEDRAVLDIRAEGFWTRETLAAFSDTVIAAMKAIDATGRSFVILVDATDYPVQSFAVTVGLAGIVHRIDHRLWVPTAVVATKALVRFQALRTFMFPHFRIFPDQAVAVAWLESRRAERQAA